MSHFLLLLWFIWILGSISDRNWQRRDDDDDSC